MLCADAPSCGGTAETITVWDDVQKMKKFAYSGGGVHREAMQYAKAFKVEIFHKVVPLSSLPSSGPLRPWYVASKGL